MADAIQLKPLEFKVTANIETAIKNLNRFANVIGRLDMAKLRSVASSFRSFSKACDSINDASIQKVEGIGKAMESIKPISQTAINSIRQLARAVDKIDSSKLRIVNMTSVSFPASGGSVIKQGDDSSTSYSIEEVRDSIDRATSSTIDWKNILGGVKKTFHGILDVSKGVLNFALSPIKKAFGDIKGMAFSGMKMFTGMFGMLKSMITRMAIRAVIKTITKAFSEGLENVYHWSVLVGNSFASSMDKIATAGNYASNSLAAMAAPLLNAVAPAIDFIVDKVVSMLNFINQAIARFTGASTWIRAKKVAVQYADATEKAGNSAKGANEKVKELQKTLLGFDEINKLNANKDTPSGSGGSGSPGSAGGTDYGSMFEEVPIDSKISSFIDALKDAINRGDWETVGRSLGEKVNAFFDSIDFEGFGAKVGYVLDGIIQSVYYFVDEVDWKGIGAKFADFINGLTKSVNWRIFGALLAKKITVALDLALGFFLKLDTASLGKALSDFINGLFEELNTWMMEQDWYEIGQTLTQKFADFIGNIDWVTLITNLGQFIYLLFAGAINAANGIADKVVEWFEGVWNTFSATVDEYLEDFKAQGKLIFDSFLEGLLTLWNTPEKVREWIADHIVNPFIGGIKSLFGIGGEPKVEGGIEDCGSDIVKTFADGVEKQVPISYTVMSKAYETLIAPFNKLRDEYRSIVQEVSGGKVDSFSGPFAGGKVRDAVSAWNSIRADGGTYFGGLFHSLPQFARGGSIHGSMFLAGENGPEIVGHVGGRTEILNQSQLASTMYQAIKSAMASVETLLVASNSALQTAMESAIYYMNTISYSTPRANVSSAYGGQFYSNEEEATLMREQNDLLRRILAKDTTVEVSSSDIMNAFNRANQRYGRNLLTT